MVQLYVTPRGEHSARALCEAIGQIKGADALAAVTVAGPSNYAHLSLRRRLGAGALRFPGATHAGLINVRFMTLDRIAELLAAPLLAGQGRTLLTDAMRAEFVRIALAAGAGLFGEFAGHASTET